MYEPITQAARFLRRRPAFCAGVVAIMTLTIGACTAMFSAITAVLIAPLPYTKPERLVIIWHAQANAAGVVGLSPSDYAAYRDNGRTFESVAAISTRGYNVGGSSEPARVTCGRITPGLFQMLGVSASRGRLFTADDDRGSSRVVILSHELWRSQFGGDEGVVGRSVLLDAMTHTVVGIMPASFKFPPPGIRGLGEASCWLPTSFTPVEKATPGFDFIVLAKLKPGAGLDQASADAAAVAQRIWESYPPPVKSQVQLRARVVPMPEQVVASSRTALLLFTGSVILLLLIGCANVSNLMLTQQQARQREMMVRSALGATRARLLKQLFAESVLLAMVGSVGGVLLAKGMIAGTIALNAGNIPRLDGARIDLLALGFALTCAVVAGGLAGMAPAFRSGEAGAPVSGRRTAAPSFRRDKLRSALVVLEIAMAVVVLMAAALLVRSVVNLNRVAVGFESNGVLTFSVALPSTRYERPLDVENFSTAVLDRLRQIPGVSHAAAASGLPIGHTEIAVVSPKNASAGAPPFRPAAVQTLTSEYHAALGIRPVQGRLLEVTDRMGSEPVAVVSETMARTYWPGSDVIGNTMQRIGDPRPLRIVGVVADVRQAGLDRAPIPTFYVPLGQAVHPVRHLSFVVKAAGDPLQLAPDVRRIVSALDGTLPVFAVRTIDDLVTASIAARRFNTFVVSLFGVIALCLAVGGLYAVIAYLVAQSSREFGIRLAIGATMPSIIRLVLGRALQLLVGGVVIGITASAATSRFVGSLLFGVQPNDPGTYALVALLLLVVATAAILVPATRAARVDPTISLRSE